MRYLRKHIRKILNIVLCGVAVVMYGLHPYRPWHMGPLGVIALLNLIWMEADLVREARRKAQRTPGGICRGNSFNT